jgi:IPT/TIG domain.
MGPESGGTQLAITGQYLNIGSTISAYLEDLRCHVNSTQASSSRITCITSKSNGPLRVSRLLLIIDGANRTLDGNPFNYTLDPTIMEIKPLVSFASGGRMITVHGTNLDTIVKPEMVVYIDEEPTPINKTVRIVTVNIVCNLYIKIIVSEENYLKYTKHVQKVSVLNFCRLQKCLFEQKNYLVTLVHM